MKKNLRTKSATKGNQHKQAVHRTKSLKSGAALGFLNGDLPGKFEVVRELREQGNKILQDARDIVARAGENIPESAKRSIRTTSKKVATKMRERPVLTTA